MGYPQNLAMESEEVGITPGANDFWKISLDPYDMISF